MAKNPNTPKLVMPGLDEEAPPARLPVMSLQLWLYELDSAVGGALDGIESFAELLEYTKEPSSTMLFEVAAAHNSLLRARGALRRAMKCCGDPQPALVEDRHGKK